VHRRTRLHAGVRAAVAVALLAAPLAISAPVGAAITIVPGTSCRMFPSNNVWNTKVSRLPVHPKSRTWMPAMDSSARKLHPDFGPAGGGQQPYGIPWEVVPPGRPLVPVSFQYDDESDPGPYPLAASTPIEGGSDRHALMVDPDTCVLSELFATRYRPGGQSSAGSGAVWDLDSNALRPAGWTSADAAGLPILPGLVDYDQVAAGAMNHAIRVTASCTTRSYLWPARHQAGQSNPSCPPMGARFRLRASFTLPTSQCAAMCQTVLKTMKTYGLIVADNGSNWYFTGTSDARWTGTQVNQLKQIPARHFLAVDQSCLMVSPSSGRAYQPGTAAFEDRCL
jgi:hypothetical protein